MVCVNCIARLRPWSSLRFFQSLVHGVNRAWHTHEIPWWKMPLRNLAMIGIVASALLIGVIAPVILKYLEWYYWRLGLSYGAWAIVIAFKAIEWIVPPDEPVENSFETPKAEAREGQTVTRMGQQAPARLVCRLSRLDHMSY